MQALSPTRDPVAERDSENASVGSDSVTTERRNSNFVLAAIALHLCVALPLALILNIWIDEAYALLTTSRDFAFTLKHSREFETQPPFYYITLWLWRHLNDSITFARLGSVLAGVATLWAMHLAARRWLPDVRSAWLLAPLAVNTFILADSTEIRPYSILVLLACLLFILFHDGFYAERPRRAMQPLYAVTALASLATYYYMGFLLVPPAIVLLVERRWKMLATYIAWMLAVGALFVPNIVLGGQHMSNLTHALEETPSLVRSFEMVFVRLLSIPFSATFMSPMFKWMVMIVSAGSIAAALWLNRSRITPRVRALWIIAVGTSLCYVAVAQLLMGENILNRHFVPLVAPSCLAVFSAATIWGRHTSKALATWLVFALACNVFASIEKFHPLAKVGDYKRVARYLTDHEKSGQSVVIVASHAELPFQHYYHGTSQLVPLPERDDYVNYVFEEWRLESVDRVREQLAAATSPDGRLWVFMDRPADTEFFGVDLNFEYLETVLSEDYVLEVDQHFYFGHLRLFRAKAPEKFTATDAK